MTGPAKPLLVFDGDCAFCRIWIRRWQAVTGEYVDYAPYQEVAGRFPDISEAEFAASVHLVEPDGSVLRGAEAVFRSLAHSRRGGAALWIYRRVPLAARCAELGYRLVASNRRAASAVTRVLGLGDDHAAGHQYVRALLSRGLALTYLIAFCSMWSQVHGLIGSNGVLPVTSYLGALAERFGDAAYYRFPTVLWWSATDGSLDLLCAGGVVASALWLVGVLPLPASIVCWLSYLSLLTAGQVFLSFQWDILLLEAGFLGILLSPAGLMPLPSTSPPVNRAVIWAFRWLVFKLMFASGLVKLFSGDPAWRDLTALTYHYESQPLPPWTAWYAHHLPDWLHVASTGAMFAIELIVPFFIFAPRSLRHLAVLPLVGLQIAIAVSGNYCFFNLLTAVLCLSLLDDDALPARLRSPGAKGEARMASLLAVGVTTTAVVFVVFLSASALCGQIFGYARVPAPVRAVSEAVRPLRLAGTYGLFAVMTKGRPEILIEGSMDGRTWRPYEFKWKPGDVARKPSFVAPHQPRLDWQMWFAALGNYRRNPWLTQLMLRLLEGSPSVLALLASDPFEGERPAYVRAQLYRYSFSPPGSEPRNGSVAPVWWDRAFERPYHPVMAARR